MDVRPDPPDPLFLNAAAQDRSLFLTWNTAPNTRKVTLYCRRAESGPWQSVEAGLGGHALIEELENDTTYECYATRTLEGGETISSRPVTQTPRTRTARVGEFYLASQQVADQYLKSKGIDARSLHLRGQPVKVWDPSVPDGLYTDARGRRLFTLLRHADDVFLPPAAPRAPGEVRAVLKRALWPTFNPFDHPDRGHSQPPARRCPRCAIAPKRVSITLSRACERQPGAPSGRGRAAP